MNTIELLEQIRKDFVKEFDNDPQINRVCKVMINEYKLRSEALSLGVVSNNEAIERKKLQKDYIVNIMQEDEKIVLYSEVAVCQNCYDFKKLYDKDGNETLCECAK